MENPGKFITFLMMSILMVLCIVVNCMTISRAIENGNSPALAIFALVLCGIALVLDVIEMINSI